MPHLGYKREIAKASYPENTRDRQENLLRLNVDKAATKAKSEAEPRQEGKIIIHLAYRKERLPRLLAAHHQHMHALLFLLVEVASLCAELIIS